MSVDVRCVGVTWARRPPVFVLVRRRPPAWVQQWVHGDGSKRVPLIRSQIWIFRRRLWTSTASVNFARSVQGCPSVSTLVHRLGCQLGCQSVGRCCLGDPAARGLAGAILA